MFARNLLKAKNHQSTPRIIFFVSVFNTAPAHLFAGTAMWLTIKLTNGINFLAMIKELSTTFQKRLAWLKTNSQTSLQLWKLSNYIKMVNHQLEVLKTRQPTFLSPWARSTVPYLRKTVDRGK